MSHIWTYRRLRGIAILVLSAVFVSSAEVRAQDMQQKGMDRMPGMGDAKQEALGSNQLEVKEAWARATAGKTSVGAVYLSIVSQTPDRLVSASAPVASKVDLMTMEGSSGMTKMSYVKSIAVPANKPVTLTPDGLHIWLAGLKQPLKAGESFPLTLTFEKAGQRQVTVSILPLAARGPHDQMQMGH
jgi:periplasmic copper chaperone A